MDKKVHVVLAEWKYCENDKKAKYQLLAVIRKRSFLMTVNTARGCGAF
jgi:hypothetical protein